MKEGNDKVLMQFQHHAMFFYLLQATWHLTDLHLVKEEERLQGVVSMLFLVASWLMLSDGFGSKGDKQTHFTLHGVHLLSLLSDSLPRRHCALCLFMLVPCFPIASVEKSAV